MQTRHKTNSLKPRLFPNHQVYTTAVTSPEVELTALALNSIWDIVPLPANAHVIGCKWLFKIKKKVDGSIARYKVRLMAKGYTQEEGFDDCDTFSPVIKSTTVQIVITIALSNHWYLHQLDVNNAFLHGDLQETVYMMQPPGFVDSLHPSYICKLKKVLYGLKQALRAWFHKLKQFLLSQNFHSSQSDHSLFIHSSPDCVILILMYVDDIIVTGNIKTTIQSLINSLDAQFSLKDLGPFNYFLGIQVTSVDNGVHLSQSKYFTSILDKTEMTGAKLCQIPLATGVQLSKFDGKPLADPTLYRTIVGMLQYATLTHPDLTYAVNKVSQFFAQPTDTHWQAVKRILRYIQGTIGCGLHLQHSTELPIQALCDADWAGCPDDRRSTAGFAVFLGPNIVSWSSKKQATVARSSTKTEYRAMAVTTTEVVWIQAY
jgi:Reverse transcriptase (RNA-dependent DNA polymerase)